MTFKIKSKVAAEKWYSVNVWCTEVFSFACFFYFISIVSCSEVKNCVSGCYWKLKWLMDCSEQWPFSLNEQSY